MFCKGTHAWLRVEEYSGFTGRKGTTVVSVTRVLWFCVANHTTNNIANNEADGVRLRGEHHRSSSGGDFTGHFYLRQSPVCPPRRTHPWPAPRINDCWAAWQLRSYTSVDEKKGAKSMMALQRYLQTAVSSLLPWPVLINLNCYKQDTNLHKYIQLIGWVTIMHILFWVILTCSLSIKRGQRKRRNKSVLGTSTTSLS